MDIQNMIKEYTDWLHDGFSAVKTGEFYEITTPYLDRYNDHLQIYVKQNPNGSYLLTDDGEIIGNLESAGISFARSQKRREMLKQIARNFGVTMNDSVLEIQATRSTYPQRKHMLIQAMLTIDDMFVAESNPQKNFFSEDVGLFLDSNKIFYSRNFPVLGKTGGIYVYEYHLQRTENKPERYCKTINSVNTNTRNLVLFNWVDTIDQRGDSGKLILFLNDDRKIRDSDLEAFQNYDVDCIFWSQRQNPENLNLLSA